MLNLHQCLARAAIQKQSIADAANAAQKNLDAAASNSGSKTTSLRQNSNRSLIPIRNSQNRIVYVFST